MPIPQRCDDGQLRAPFWRCDGTNIDPMTVVWQCAGWRVLQARRRLRGATPHTRRCVAMSSRARDPLSPSSPGGLPSRHIRKTTTPHEILVTATILRALSHLPHQAQPCLVVRKPGRSVKVALCCRQRDATTPRALWTMLSDDLAPRGLWQHLHCLWSGAEAERSEQHSPIN